MNPLVVEDLATLLAAQSFGLTLGTNLFLGVLPDTPDSCSALIEMAGRQAQFTMGGGGVATRRPIVRFLTRAVDYEEARRLADDVYDYFSSVVDLDVGTHRYHVIEPQTEPRSGGPDASDRERAIVDFDVRMQP